MKGYNQYRQDEYKKFAKEIEDSYVFKCIFEKMSVEDKVRFKGVVENAFVRGFNSGQTYEQKSQKYIRDWADPLGL